jgi:hypothetical protein
MGEAQLGVHLKRKNVKGQTKKKGMIGHANNQVPTLGPTQDLKRA